uniref:Reverse transcriptase domain-containing protein n=1 Tax=Globodera pallida TaxID=36090 RepID=A0A183C958_GLOPA
MKKAPDKKAQEEGQNVKLGDAKLAKDNSNKLKKNLLKLGEVLGREGRRTPPHRRDRKVLRDIVKPRGKRGKDPDFRHAETKEQELKQYPHVQKLFRVERFYRLLQRCDEFIRRKDEDHSKLLQRSGVPFQLHTKAVEQSPFLGVAETQLLKNMNLGLSNGNETLAWLDLLLQISGASSTLDKLISSIEPAFEEVQQRIYPAVLRLEELEERFRRLRNVESGKQRQEMDSRGYTFLSKEQSRIVLGQAEDADGGGLDEEDLEEVLEKDIRSIAQMSEHEMDSVELESRRSSKRKREKRFLRTEPFGQVRLLNPYLFANQLHDGAVLRRVALSPRAFSSSIMSPEFGQLEVLSPRAFSATILSPRAAIANILSPSALTFRLLSPQAFLAEVLNPKAFVARILSPRAMSAYVLSPRAFMFTILSPKALELRVLSPTTLSFTVLSPTIGGAKIASPQSFSMAVLSPSILSPSFLNKGGVSNVKILSPSILSGGGGEAEK